MSIAQELKAIKGSKEFLIVEDVHRWAKSHPRSDLHRELQWNDKRAGYEFRLWQIRRLIAIYVTYEDGGGRKMISLTIDRSRDGGGYRDVDDILKDKALYEIMLADALRDLQRVHARYDQLKELRPLWKMTTKIRRSFEKGGKERRSAAR